MSQVRKYMLGAVAAAAMSMTSMTSQAAITQLGFKLVEQHNQLFFIASYSINLSFLLTNKKVLIDYSHHFFPKGTV